MKAYALIISLLLSTGAFASARIDRFTSLASCYHGVTFSSEYMVASLTSRMLQVEYLNAKGTHFISLQDTFVDMQVDGEDLYVLTHSVIEHWNLKDMTLVRSIPTHKEPSPYEWNMGPQGIEIYGQKIFVAHDGRGVTVLDKTTGSIIGGVYPQGFSQDVTIQNGKAYVLTDTAEIVGGAILSGIFTFDPETYKITKKTLLNSAPSGSLVLRGEDFYIGSRFFWKVARKKVETSKIVNGYSRVIIPPTFAQGKPFFDETHAYFCFENGTPGVVKLP